MNPPTGDRKGRPANAPGENGSALVMAVFVLVLLAGMGSALLFLSENEMKMSNAGLRTMKAFYLAEAGIEDGRTALWDFNRNGPFSDDLDLAAGPDLTIDFDPTTIVATRDADGNVTGFIGTTTTTPSP